MTGSQCVMRVIFFLKVFKFLSAFQKWWKSWEKAFCFLDNWIWIGCINLSLLRRENLWSTVNVFTNSPRVEENGAIQDTFLKSQGKFLNNYLRLLILNSKTPLRETGYLGNSYFAGCLSIQFFSSHIHVTDLWDTMPHQRSITCTHTHVTYGTPCHARGHFTHTLGSGGFPQGW